LGRREDKRAAKSSKAEGGRKGRDLRAEIWGTPFLLL